MTRYAESMNYWDTTVSPAKSQAEITDLLEEFGAESVMQVTGKSGGKFAWLIRFQWEGRNYRFSFVPLECRYPNQERTWAGKRRKHSEQARYQMGRIAVYVIKALLTAAEAQPAALFGFLELPASTPGAMPPVASEIGLPNLASIGLLPEGTDFVEGEFTSK